MNTAVSQMGKVTQQNAAGAEESASASEELAAQAAAVKGMVDELAAVLGARRKDTDSDGFARGKQAKDLRRKRPDLRVAHLHQGRRGAPAGTGADAARKASPRPEGEPADEFLSLDDKDLKEF